MERIVKFLFYISVFIFLVMALYVYAFLPDYVELNSIVGSIKLTKDMFFYTSLVLYIVFIAVGVVFSTTIQRIPAKSKSIFSPKRKEKLVLWAKFLKVVISVFFIFSITFIGMSQNDEHFNISNFGFLVYLGPVLVFFWLISLFFLLTKNT